MYLESILTTVTPPSLALNLPDKICTSRPGQNMYTLSAIEEKKSVLADRPVLEFDVIYSARRALSLGTYCSLVVSGLQPCPHAVLQALSLGEQPLQPRLNCRVFIII